MDKYRIIQEDSVLLLIDLQEKMMQAINSCDRICKNVIILLKVAQKLKIPIVLTEQYPKGLGMTLPEIKQYADGAYYVEKLQFSAFVPELQRILTGINRKTILVAGVETHICVYQTVRDLVTNGFSVHTIMDALGSRTEANYINGLQLIIGLGAVVNNTETVLFDILKTASDPNFKQISTLVK